MPKYSNYMPIEEFLEDGWLQEVNRLFFHPRGLALVVTVPTEEGEPPATLSGIWDYREDPEGIVFSNVTLASEKARRKAAHVQAEFDRHLDERERRFGPGGIQEISPQAGE